MNTDIVTGNKLIYCFMNPENEKTVMEFKDWWWDDKMYHTSWDWLIPVCIKLGMSTVSVNINKTYNEVLEKIKQVV